jgi:H+/gluconate symporter-like permease
MASVTTPLAGITGSASGGMSIALAAMADSFVADRTAYMDVFAITLIKSAAVFVVIGVYYATGIY